MSRPSLILLAAASLLPLLPPGRLAGQGLSFLDKPMAGWMKDLKSPDAPVRRSAAFALGRLGEDSWIAVPQLAARVRSDRDGGVRAAAASAVGDVLLHFPGDATDLWAQAGRDLIGMLERETSPRAKRSAAYAIGAFGKAAGEGEAALRQALSDRDPTVRQNAAWALGRLGAVDATSLAELCARLADDNALVRRDAAGALGALPREGNARVAARALLEMVKTDKDEVARKTALDSLARLVGPEHKDSAADLYPLLESKDVDVARGAAFVLGNMGEEVGSRPVPVLRRALGDSDPAVQALAAAALSNLGAQAESAAPELVGALTLSTDPEVRRNSAIALGKLKEKGRNAVPALARALRVVPDAPTDPVRARPFEEVREHAAEALSRIDYPANEGAVPAIREVIARDTNPEVRLRAIECVLHNTDLDKFDLIPVLTRVLAEEDPEMLMVRYNAARLLALVRRERAPDRVVEILLHMLSNRSLRVFNGSDATVTGTGSEATRGSSAVRPNQGGDARFMAAQALGFLRAKARSSDEVMRALRAAAEDKDSPVLRETARAALDRLGK